MSDREKIEQFRELWRQFGNDIKRAKDSGLCCFNEHIYKEGLEILGRDKENKGDIKEV